MNNLRERCFCRYCSYIRQGILERARLTFAQICKESSLGSPNPKCDDSNFQAGHLLLMNLELRIYLLGGGTSS